MNSRTIQQNSVCWAKIQCYRCGTRYKTYRDVVRCSRCEAETVSREPLQRQIRNPDQWPTISKKRQISVKPNGEIWFRKNQQRTSFLRKPMEGTDRCCICIDTIANGTLIPVLSGCCHHFHEECLTGWIENGWETCPICKGNI